MHVLCFLRGAWPTTSSAGTPKNERRKETDARGPRRTQKRRRWEKEGDTFESWNTPEISDQVKIIARLFKHLTDRPRTARSFLLPFRRAPRFARVCVRECGTHTRVRLVSTLAFFHIVRVLPATSSLRLLGNQKMQIFSLTL